MTWILIGIIFVIKVLFLITITPFLIAFIKNPKVIRKFRKISKKFDNWIYKLDPNIIVEF